MSDDKTNTPVSPDAKSIVSDILTELKEHPDHWTQGCTARNSNGDPVAFDSPVAVCWCLFGHYLKRGCGYKVYDIAKPLFDAAGLSPDDGAGFNAINDTRTLAEIISLCEQVVNG